MGNATQGKLVWLTTGIVYDVFVDLRKSSPTYGKWDGYFLNATTHQQIWLPLECAHGFLVVSDTADFPYKATAPYSPNNERFFHWNDPELDIPWPLKLGHHPILSPKDASATSFRTCEKYH